MNPYEKQDSGKAVTSGTSKPGRFSHRIAMVVCILHSIAVIAFGALVHSVLQSSTEGAMLWFIWIVIDFPVSLGLSAAISIAESMPMLRGLSFVRFHTFVYGGFYVFFGGLQYYILSGWLGGWVQRRRNRTGQASLMSEPRIAPERSE